MLTSSYDKDVTGDGKFDSIKIYTYDNHNNKLSEGLDRDGDGVVDSQKHIYINSYDNYRIPDNFAQSLGIVAVWMVNKNSLHLGEYESLKKDSLDLYPFLRDIYEQKRVSEIAE